VSDGGIPTRSLKWGSQKTLREVHRHVAVEAEARVANAATLLIPAHVSARRARRQGADGAAGIGPPGIEPPWRPDCRTSFPRRRATPPNSSPHLHHHKSCVGHAARTGSHTWVHAVLIVITVMPRGFFASAESRVAYRLQPRAPDRKGMRQTCPGSPPTRRQICPDKGRLRNLLAVAKVT